MEKRTRGMPILILLIILLSGFVSAHEKQIEVKINDDFSEEKIIWEIKLDKFLSYLPVADWGILIPKDSTNIIVNDSKGAIEYKIEQLQDSEYNFLKFKNRERIFYNSNYFFEISYRVNNKPLAYEPYFFYKRTFTRFENDNSFNLTFSLPKEATIIHLSEQSLKTITKNSILKYELKKGETKTFEIDFVQLKNQIELTKISSKYYTIEVPKRYEKNYLSILEKADAGVGFIESIYGFRSPYKWNIEIINPEAKDFEENFEGFYLGDGKIRIKLTQLKESEKEVLYMILHETVHGFNSKFFGDAVPNFWWEEGTAQYIAFKALEAQSYNTDEMKKKNFDLVMTCKKNEKSFITGWSPNTELIKTKEEKIICESEKIDSIKLGYAYSFFIVNTLVEKYGENVFRKFYTTAQELNIKFSSNHTLLNNQMNYVLTKALGEDLTPLLNSLNIKVEKINDKSLKEKSIITGMPISSEEEENKSKFYSLLILVIIAITLIIIFKHENLSRTLGLKSRAC